MSRQSRKFMFQKFGISIAVTFSLLQIAVAAESGLPKDAAQEAQPSSSGQIVLVVGAPGTPEFGEQFADWAKTWIEVAQTSKLEMETIGLEGDTSVPDRERVQQALKSVALAAKSPLWLVMIGHGTYTRGVAKFNLRGPDFSSAELAAWLKEFERPVVIVNCTSSSGPFVNDLSGDGRVVVTATRSGNELNFARFGEYFAKAIASTESDLDHDDEVSVQEAFLRASAEVRQFYDSESRIPSEHALLDDNGDGKGTPASMFRGIRAIATAKDGAVLDGARASRLTISPSGNRLVLNDDELERRSQIESQLDQIRRNRGDESDTEYDAKIEPLLLELARIYQTAESRSR